MPRGRPKGAKGAIPRRYGLYREYFLVAAYQQARTGGVSHAVAMLRAVATLRAAHPWLRASVTTVRQALATWQPAGRALVLPKVCDDDLIDHAHVARQLVAFQGERDAGTPAREALARAIAEAGPAPHTSPRADRPGVLGVFTFPAGVVERRERRWIDGGLREVTVRTLSVRFATRPAYPDLRRPLQMKLSRKGTG